MCSGIQRFLCPSRDQLGIEQFDVSEVCSRRQVYTKININVGQRVITVKFLNKFIFFTSGGNYIVNISFMERIYLYPIG